MERQYIQDGIVGTNKKNSIFKNVYNIDNKFLGVNENTENIAEIPNMKSEEFTKKLNSYKNEEGIYPKDWKKWTWKDNGYPHIE